MKVLAFPKYKNGGNPYTNNLYKYFEKCSSYIIDEFTFWRPFLSFYDIFHLHWPDYFFVRSRSYTLVRVAYLFLIVTVFKASKTKLIWTVHNLEPHNNYHPRLYEFFIHLWCYLIDGFIVMSDQAHFLIKNKYPMLKYKRYKVIYHGIYDNYLNDISPINARKYFSIKDDTKVLLFIGTIDKYKNVLSLINEFNKLDEKKYMLIIAGKVKNNELKNKIIRKSINKNIVLHLQYISDEKLQFYYNACDMVIIPYKRILNSGSVMLALTFNKSVMCPHLGSIVELQSILGEKTINTYKSFSLTNIYDIILNSQPPCSIIMKQFRNNIQSHRLLKFYQSL